MVLLIKFQIFDPSLKKKKKKKKTPFDLDAAMAGESQPSDAPEPEPPAEPPAENGDKEQESKPQTEGKHLRHQHQRHVSCQCLHSI